MIYNHHHRHNSSSQLEFAAGEAAECGKRQIPGFKDGDGGMWCGVVWRVQGG